MSIFCIRLYNNSRILISRYSFFSFLDQFSLVYLKRWHYNADITCFSVEIPLFKREKVRDRDFLDCFFCSSFVYNYALIIRLYTLYSAPRIFLRNDGTSGRRNTVPLIAAEGAPDSCIICRIRYSIRYKIRCSIRCRAETNPYPWQQ